MFTKKIISALILASCSMAAAANDSFVIQSINIQGLQGVNKATVLNYLPVHAGEVLTDAKSAASMQALYKTGFFQDVQLVRNGNILVVNVVERPSIAAIKITGSKELSQEKLAPVLKGLGLVEGQPFNPAAIAKVKAGLQAEYARRGKENTVIEIKVSPKQRNRVNVVVNIKEGQPVKISQIQIVGNQAFKKRELTRTLILTTTRPWSFVTHANEFSKEKLAESLESLRNFYLDRGYVRFAIEGTQTQLTPDQRNMTLIIHVNEGPLYRINTCTFSGSKLLSQETLLKLIDIKPGHVFSKQKVSDAIQAIGRALGNDGYAFANITAAPVINDSNHTITLNFSIEPGKRVYVRRINFTGNSKTEDRVLRHELKQYEGALVSTGNIEESKRHLNLLGYLDSVDVQTKAVPGRDDQVDLDINVKEGTSAQATASIGYGTQKFVFQAAINQNNFLGTGKALNIGFDTSSYAKNYNISYNNPYYTTSGIQRGFNLYIQDTTPANLDLASYTTSSYGASVNYSIPIFTADDNIQLGYGYQGTVIDLGSSPSTQLADFVTDHGRHFDQVLLTAGWSRNGLDRAIFPTQGWQQTLGSELALPAGSTALQYYKINYQSTWYHPLNQHFIFVAKGAAGYGNGLGDTHALPFFENYYAGGLGFPGAVRGYSTYSLGPKDTKSDPLGGNMFVAGSAAVIFPNPLHMENLRTSVFVDAGNAYNTRHIPQLSYHAGPLRTSSGLMAELRLGMLGVLDFSVAKTLNARPGDSKEVFKFTIGAGF